MGPLLIRKLGERLSTKAATVFSYLLRDPLDFLIFDPYSLLHWSFPTDFSFLLTVTFHSSLWGFSPCILIHSFCFYCSHLGGSSFPWGVSSFLLNHLHSFSFYFSHLHWSSFPWGFSPFLLPVLHSFSFYCPHLH
ncbi:hypothetical protein XELAEV_18000408mg [Xenopus laevis]|uniref:Uncharacterized protein n=1 Tax=Xenopus laevis TaxID=8355 RepID=A0A974BQI3_XENLA|nr:hypothetical protein XELAEV_18000408mg [Xenopus laevis]